MRPSWSSLLGGCLGGGGSGAAAAAGKVQPPGVTVPFTDQDLPAGSSDPDCLHVFTFGELNAAAGGFDSYDNLIGVGVLGSVYKGFLLVDDDDDGGGGGVKPAQAVAVRVIDRRDAALRREELLEEAIFLGKLRHPNLVRMIGYCREKAGEVAVYEYMAHGSLENHLFRRTTNLQDIPAVLPWSTRLNIAIGVARGLSFLHDAGEKPFVHGDLKASDILLDEQFNAKLSYERLPKDYVLVRGCRGGMSVVVAAATPRCHSPEYFLTIDGCLTVKNDVYDFGVVLLELLAGRRSVDYARPVEERNLVEFARPSLMNPRTLPRIVDPALEGRYAAAAAQTMAMVVYKCLADKPKKRPDMAAVVRMLEPLLGVADGFAPVDAAGSSVAPAP